MITLFLIMLILFVMAVPVAWSMAIASGLYMVLGPKIPLQGLVQRMIGGIDTFPLLAIPFFILAGNLMNTGGITERLVRFSKALVGHIRGGLAHVVVVTNMIMAGMSGSGIADAAGSGAVLIPAMKQAGYGVPFAAAVVGAAGTIGPIIPPSIPFVIYGSLANTSIGRLLLAGAVPGILMGMILMAFVYVIAKRRNYPAETRASRTELLRATLHAIPPMGMPIIILGGIIAGVMTPTEAACAGAAYAFVLGFFVYGELTLRDFPKIVTESVAGTAAVAIIIAAAQPMGWILTYEQAPMKVLALFQDAQFSKFGPVTDHQRDHADPRLLPGGPGRHGHGRPRSHAAAPPGRDRSSALRRPVRPQHHDRHHYAACRDDHVRGLRPGKDLDRSIQSGGLAVHPGAHRLSVRCDLRSDSFDVASGSLDAAPLRRKEFRSASA